MTLDRERLIKLFPTDSHAGVKIDAILQDIADQGLVIVPREATETARPRWHLGLCASDDDGPCPGLVDDSSGLVEGSFCTNTSDWKKIEPYLHAVWDASRAAMITASDAPS